MEWMEWNMIFELIDPALFIVVGACWVIGYMLKQTPAVPDWSIVYIVVVLAVVFYCWNAWLERRGVDTGHSSGGVFSVWAPSC